MQSGYSELMGLYPPGAGDQLTKAQRKVVEGISAPPFKVRDAGKINEEMGADALPQSLVAIPVPNFENADIHDDVGYDGCPYMNTVHDARVDDDAIWEKYEWMREQTRDSFKAEYDLTDEYIDAMNFHHYERLSDTAVALDFEGYPEHETYFSED